MAPTPRPSPRMRHEPPVRRAGRRRNAEWCPAVTPAAFDAPLTGHLRNRDSNLVTVLIDATILQETPTGPIGFTPGAARIEYLRYEDGKPTVITGASRAKACTAQVAKVLYGPDRHEHLGGPGTEAPRVEHDGARVKDPVVRYHRSFTEDEAADLTGRIGVRLLTAELIAAPCAPSGSKAPRPAIAFLHFHCPRDEEGSALPAKRFIDRWCRRRGLYGAGKAGPEHDRDGAGRERLAYLLSALDLFPGIVFAMLELTETRESAHGEIDADTAVGVRRLLDAGTVRRPYTITTFIRSFEPKEAGSLSPEDHDLLWEARDWVTGQTSEKRRATEGKLEKEFTLTVEHSKDWFAFVGVNGTSYGLAASSFDTTGTAAPPFGPSARVYAHTIYADAMAYVLFGARLTQELATTVGKIVWHDAVETETTERVDSTLLALDTIYLAKEVTSAPKEQAIIDILRRHHDSTVIVEQLRQQVEQMTRVARRRQQIRNEVGARTRRILLEFITYMALPLGIADRLAQAVVHGSADTPAITPSQIGLTVVLAIIIGLLFWAIVRSFQRRTPEEREAIQRRRETSALERKVDLHMHPLCTYHIDDRGKADI